MLQNLNKFIMSSDYDGQKETNDIEIEYTVQSFSLPARSGRQFETTQDAPSGTLFANTSISTSLTQGFHMPTGSASLYIDDGAQNDCVVAIVVYRSDMTHYKMLVSFNNQSTTYAVNVPTFTIKAKVRFYVASVE